MLVIENLHNDETCPQLWICFSDPELKLMARASYKSKDNPEYNNLLLPGFSDSMSEKATKGGSAISAKRFACDRCHSQKLRCPRLSVFDKNPESCMRCVKGGKACSKFHMKFGEF